MQPKVDSYFGWEVAFMSIGQRITELRKEHNISQLQLAKLLDVTRQAVSKWENDLASPDTVRLIQLADILNTDVEYLATGVHSAIKEPPKIVTVVEKEIVEKVVEKPVEIEKIVEVEKIVETFVEKPVIRKVVRTRYVRNPIEFTIVGIAGMIIGLVIGLLL